MLAEIEHAQRRVFCKDGHHDYGAALFDGLHEAAYAAFHARHLESHLESFVAEYILHSLGERGPAHVQSVFDAALPGHFEPQVGHVGDEHLLCSGGDDCLGHQVAYGPGARHHHVLAAEVPCAGCGVGAHCRRFHHGAVVQRHVVRQAHHPVVVHHEIVLRRSVGLEGLHPQVLTHVVLPAAARGALPADELRTGGNPVTGFANRDIRTDGRDYTGILMPLDNRIIRCRMLSVVGMDFAAADADALDVHQHLVRPQILRPRGGHLPELKVFRLNKYDLSHFRFL